VLCVGTMASAGSALLAILSIEDLDCEFTCGCIDDLDCECEVSGLHKPGAVLLIFGAGLALTFESFVTIFRILGVYIIGVYRGLVSTDEYLVSKCFIFYL